jgi:protein phosphatase
VALTDVGRKRDHNEDYLGDLLIKSGRGFGPEKLDEKGHLFAVADGMGGHAAGEVASEMAVTTLFEAYYNSPSSGSVATDLARAVASSNLEVHNAGAAPGRNHMGTTLTLALLKGNRALIANVGDSRTYLVRQGVPLRVTHDHSLIQDHIDMGTLTPEQAEHSLMRNVITRAIGYHAEVDADFFEEELQPGDVLLLCSDGLHGQVHEPEMGAIVASAPNLKEAAQQLINLANERGGPDNVSVLLVKVLELGTPLPNLLAGQKTANFALNEATVPLANNFGADAGPQTSLGKPLDEQTERFSNPMLNNLESQPTKPTNVANVRSQASPSPNLTAGKKNTGSRFGIIVGSLILVVVIALAVYFLVINPSNNNTSNITTSPSPTISVTATVDPATLAPTTIPVPPTVTPALGSRLTRSIGLTNTPGVGEPGSNAGSGKTVTPPTPSSP